jgi:SAM-dependent methyltransferase
MTNEIWKPIPDGISIKEPTYSKLISELYDVSWLGKVSSEEIEYYRTHIQGLTTLEVTCGSGRVFVPLLQAGCNIYGIDMSIPMLDNLKSRLSSSNYYRVIRWDTLQTPYPVAGESFERIIIPFSSFTIMHSLHLDELDDNKAFHEFYRILRPGGLVIISDPRTYVFDKSGDVSGSIAWQELQGKDPVAFNGRVEDGKLLYTFNKQHPKHGAIREEWSNGYKLIETRLFPAQVIQEIEKVFICVKDNQILEKQQESFPIWDIDDYPKIGEEAGFEYFKKEETPNFYPYNSVSHVFRET